MMHGAYNVKVVPILNIVVTQTKKFVDTSHTTVYTYIFRLKDTESQHLEIAGVSDDFSQGAI